MQFEFIVIAFVKVSLQTNYEKIKKGEGKNDDPRVDHACIYSAIPSIHTSLNRRGRELTLSDYDVSCSDFEMHIYIYIYYRYSSISLSLYLLHQIISATTGTRVGVGGWLYIFSTIKINLQIVAIQGKKILHIILSCFLLAVYVT